MEEEVKHFYNTREEWDLYFERIKGPCPWSYADWHAGLIQIVETYKPMALGDYTARIYIVDIHHMDLRAYCEHLNDTRDDEWFYSDPESGEYGAPVSILIQQDPAKLQKIRQKTGTFCTKV